MKIYEYNGIIIKANNKELVRHYLKRKHKIFIPLSDLHLIKKIGLTRKYK